MIFQLLKVFAATKFYLWIRPRIKSISILFVAIVLILYGHNEYINWAEKSGNMNYLGYSFILKNLLIFLAFVIFVLLSKNIKNNQVLIKENDGFDEIRNKKKLRSKLDNLLDKD